jgi:hypothetical protein
VRGTSSLSACSAGYPSSENHAIFPGALRDELLHGAHHRTFDRFGDVLGVASFLPTQQALYESLSMLLVFIPPEQWRVTIQERLQLRLQSSQLSPVHGMAPHGSQNARPRELVLCNNPPLRTRSFFAAL